MNSVSRLRPEENWGFAASGEMSSFGTGSASLSSSNAAIALLRRDSVGPRGELLSSLGVRYKDLPSSVTDTSNVTTKGNFAALGPELGMDYIFKMSSFWSASFGAHFSEMLLSLKTPNDRALDPSLCSEFELSVSQRWTHTFATSIGFRHRDDQLLFQSVSGASDNVISIRSDSLKLTFELDF